jgi:hypothetical protein
LDNDDSLLQNESIVLNEARNLQSNNRHPSAKRYNHPPDLDDVSRDNSANTIPKSGMTDYREINLNQANNTVNDINRMHKERNVSPMPMNTYQNHP